MRIILDDLEEEAKQLGKPFWRPMLQYVAALHSRSIRLPEPPFKRAWEEIGPGYFNSPAFGHWDIIHAILDVLPAEPEHALNQIDNVLDLQQIDGVIAGSVWMRKKPYTANVKGHPPVWVYAVEAYCRQRQDYTLAVRCLEPLRRNIGWFERQRRATDGGYYYLDILTFDWESGIDEGVRFDHAQPGPFCCIDAVCHVYWLYEHAARWMELAGAPDREHYAARAEELREFIQTRLFDAETGFFHDIWSVNKPELRRLCFEGMWPVVVGVATPEQARRVIDENLLSPDRFFTIHPLATVAVSDPAFEKRMWRGPVWNSMTYWAALGCIRYGRPDAARLLLERALDASAAQFERTGTIWEFYDSLGGQPEGLKRKPNHDLPCRDYLGHNPLLAMARLHDAPTVR